MGIPMGIPIGIPIGIPTGIPTGMPIGLGQSATMAGKAGVLQKARFDRQARHLRAPDPLRNVSREPWKQSEALGSSDWKNAKWVSGQIWVFWKVRVPRIDPSRRPSMNEPRAGS